MGLEVFSENDSRLWDEAVDSSPFGTIYHSWKWLNLVEKHCNCQLYPLAYFDARDRRPFGLIPLFLMKKFGIKMVFSPPPGSAINLGPMIIDKEYRQHKFELTYLDFQAAVDKFIRDLGASYTYMLTSPDILDMRPFIWAKYQVTPYYTYKIDLSTGKDNIWKKLSSSLKLNIKNASRRGIKIIESQNTEDVRELHSSLKQRYAQQYLNLPLKLEYLEDLFNEFKPSAIKLYLALFEGKVVGSQFCLQYKDTSISWCGGSRTQTNQIEANELLMWFTIEKAIQDGFKWFEIEGANTRHLCDAKSRYCPEISMYFKMKKAGFIGSLAEKAYYLMQKKYL